MQFYLKIVYFFFDMEQKKKKKKKIPTYQPSLKILCQ